MKSSTETEIIEVDDAMIFTVWTKLFFEQKIEDHDDNKKNKLLGKTNEILQDNTSLYNQNGMAKG